jgi:asparagine synthase (glutamine-hydrolysing)
MCGIAGAIAFRKKLDPAAIVRATKALEHRGPDDTGVEQVANGETEAVFGNRRLAILDLSPCGHMPMQDAESGDWITYNGEIFNFKDLRTELKNLGHQFTSRSDTEVILASYARWGPAFLHRLRGMFAIAIFDKAKQQLFIARDRFGIKPLYFWQDADSLIFSSEVRSLLKSGVPRKLNPVGVAQYTLFGSVYDPETIIEGVHSLLPGHYLLWHEGKMQINRYWDLAAAAAEPDERYLNEAGVLKNIHQLLEESVSLHTVSDVPVSVFLSGGIDSTAVAAILNRQQRHIQSYSVVFKEADYTESSFSRLVAERFKTEHHEIVLSQDDAKALIPEAMSALDQPSFDGTNSYVVAQQVRRAGFKVALSGLGGDELFAGYGTTHTVPQIERWLALLQSLPLAMRQGVAAMLSSAFNSGDQRRKLKALLVSKNGIDVYALMRQVFTKPQVENLLAHHEDSVFERAFAPLSRDRNLIQKMDPVNRVSYLEQTGYMRNTLLRDTDAMSMANSLEVRVPMIDHVLAEYLIRIPGQMKVKHGTPKYLLSSALSAMLPREIVFRRKQGFVLPFQHWLRGDLGKEVVSTFESSAQSPLAEYIRPEYLQTVWQQFTRGETSWSRPWSLYTLHRWCAINMEN